jgi:HAD superfamily hydrolase (TIGR01450 family)
LGTRLRPITDSKPKCLVKAAGKPILQHQIEAYLAAGAEQVLVVSGYRGEAVESFCAAYGEKARIVRNDDYSTTNNMYSLYLAYRQLGDEGFLLSNGDVVYDPGILRDLLRADGSFIAADQGSYADESMKIVVENGVAVDISKKIPPALAYGNSIDLYRFDAAAARQFGEGIRNVIEGESNRNEWTELALQKMLQSHRIQMKPFDIGKRNWVEIDNFEDLAAADGTFSRFDLAAMDLVFVDLDGTLYLGSGEVQGAADFMRRLQASGKPYLLLSNNSSRDKAQYVEKLARFGIAVTEDEILLSTDGAIAHMLEMGIKSVYVLGTEALRRSLEKAGIQTEGREPQAVLLGYDTELTYAKLKQAALLIHRGCPYMATHADVVCPTTEGPIPDIGSMTALLEKATGHPPLHVFGKPSATMVDHVVRARGVAHDKVAFIGDRLYTDMLMARGLGAKFILVLSGETRREAVEEMDDFPDLIVPSVASLLCPPGTP